MLKLRKINDNPIVTLDPYEYEGFRFSNSNVDSLSLSKNILKRDFFISLYRVQRYNNSYHKHLKNNR